MTIGITIGKAIGNTASYAVHGAKGAAQYTGYFGKDVVEGTTTQYAVKSAELAQLRATRQAPIAIKVERKAKATA